MPFAVVVIVLVAEGALHEPATRAIAPAARAALGPDAVVEVREEPPAALDAPLPAPTGDRATADVRWVDATHARLRVRSSGDARVVEREIGFEPSDAASERGRALGFALASMLPSPAADTPKAAAPAPPPASPAPLVGAVYAAGSGTIGLGGDASAIGGTLAGEWYWTPRLALRAGASVRSGAVNAAQATTLLVAPALGARAILLPDGPGHPFGLAVRLDVLAVYQQVSHLSDDDPAPDRKDRWLPGADLLGEASWAFAGSGMVVLGAGVEAVTESTDIYTHNEIVAELPVARLLVEVGVRARF